MMQAMLDNPTREEILLTLTLDDDTMSQLNIKLVDYPM